MIIFWADNELYIVNNKDIINYKLKSINKGYIINKELFINEFSKIIKKEKIKLKLLGNKIKIVKNSYFKESDLFYIEDIFNELGFLKIEYIDIKEFFREEGTFIEVNNSYLVLNIEDGIYLDLDYFKDIPRILNYFGEMIKKEIIFFGLNKNIPLLKVNNKDVYYMDNFQKFIPDSLLKIKK